MSGLQHYQFGLETGWIMGLTAIRFMEEWQNGH